MILEESLVGNPLVQIVWQRLQNTRRAGVCVGDGAARSSEQQRGAERSGSVWAVSFATTSTSTVLSSSAELLGSVVVLRRNLQQR